MANVTGGNSVSSSAQLGADVVTAPAIRDGEVKSAEILDESILTSDIKNGEILDADINASASIADTKLATISTAGKVSGAALTSLASIPAGAGVIPTANLPVAPGGIVVFPMVNGGIVSINGTVYMRLNGGAQSTTETKETMFICPRAGTIRNFTCRPGGANYPSFSCVSRIRVNEANSTILITHANTGADTTEQDTTHSVSVSAGDRISISFTSTLANTWPFSGYMFEFA